jgi:hypothetical protein
VSLAIPKNFSRLKRRNPLKSPDSHAQIQGNERKRKSRRKEMKAKSPWIKDNKNQTILFLREGTREVRDDDKRSKSV